MNFGIERIFRIDPWKIIEDEFRPDKNEETESIFSIANEYMGTRGSFEEGYSGKTMEGCYIAGVYSKEKIAYDWKRRAFPTYANSMIHTTNWLRTIVEVDGEAFGMAESRFSDYRRELDMKLGVLSRRLVFTTKKGLGTVLEWERFVSHDDRHLAALRLRIRALDHERPIMVHFLLDGRKENTYFSNSVVHTKALAASASDGFLSLLKMVSTTGQYYMHRMNLRADHAASVALQYTVEDSAVECAATFVPKKNREYAFDRIVSVWTSRDAGFPFGLIPKDTDSTDVDQAKEATILEFMKAKSIEHLHAYDGIDYEKIRLRHTECLANIWKRLDVEIEGDDLSQQGIRFCMFQLYESEGRSDLRGIAASHGKPTSQGLEEGSRSHGFSGLAVGLHGAQLCGQDQRSQRSRTVTYAPLAT